MKFGAREICDVVLKATVNGQKIGNQVYRKGQPVMYFDSLKTSSMEQSSTPVYAQGGKGNTKLVSWDGEKAITYVMEDALISPISLAILAKAGITKPGKDSPLTIHTTKRIKAEQGTGVVYLPFESKENNKVPTTVHADYPIWIGLTTDEDREVEMWKGTYDDSLKGFKLAASSDDLLEDPDGSAGTDPALVVGSTYVVDFYVDKAPGEDNDSALITIAPESFDGGNFYLEASTLFRSKNGIDYPAEFIIPNCKPQSAMTFAMAGSGDPSTFTFTMDAFPGYTVFDTENKVLAAIQIIDDYDTTSIEDYNGLTQF